MPTLFSHREPARKYNLREKCPVKAGTHTSFEKCPSKAHTFLEQEQTQGAQGVQSLLDYCSSVWAPRERPLTCLREGRAGLLWGLGSVTPRLSPWGVAGWDSDFRKECWVLVLPHTRCLALHTCCLLLLLLSSLLWECHSKSILHQNE